MLHGESRFQQAAVRMLRNNGYFCFSVPNGAKLSQTQARIAKAEGVMKGVSDLIVLLPHEPIFVEFKNPNGKGRQSPEQKAFEQAVKDLGYRYFVWDSWEKVEQFINSYKDYTRHDLKIGGTNND